MNEVKAMIDLTEPTLFGNDAAEDETQEVFDSYFVSRPEIDDFLSLDHRLHVLRAYRGEGKSAVLRNAFRRLSEKGSIVIHTTGSSMSPKNCGSGPDEWTAGWKHSIFSRIANEIGTQIGMAWTDDAMSLVEEAEKNGFKSRSVFTSVFDRLKTSVVPLDREKVGSVSPDLVVQRWLKDKARVWVLVDDVDENFENTREFRAKLASFFSACRQIVNLVPEINIRAGIRPNIWTVVRSDAESLSKVDQYMLDLRWNDAQMRSVLSRRIEGYIERTNQKKVIQAICNLRGAEREEYLIGMAFRAEMPWGFDKGRMQQKLRPPHVIMSTLSRNRPRWMIELSKAAARTAKATAAPKIEFDHITKNLAAFGKQRILDLSAEYASLCPQIQDIISAFVDQSEDFSTAELHEIINRRILPGVNVTISGVGTARQPSSVGALLYEIGFLTARKDLPDGTYVHFSYADKPELLHSKTNIDQGMTWEIHPVFRQALGVRTAYGSKEYDKRSKNTRER